MKIIKNTFSMVAALLLGSGTLFAQNPVTFNYTGSIVNWTVPAGVTCINIEAKGAEGGNHTSSNYSPGLGATLVGDFTVTPGQQLKILVGQQPSSTSGNGGGGGTFVTDMSNNPLIIAGGGAGSAGCGNGDNPTKHGNANCDGANGPVGTGGLGGQNGNGGTAGGPSFQSGAGGGLLTDGANGWTSNTGGKSFLNGGAGATTNGNAHGGFGGGGSGSAWCVGGAGGGYSGGGSGSANTSPSGSGGGGGSYNGGFNAVNTSGNNSGHGVVVITLNGNCSGVATPCPGATPPCATTNTFKVGQLSALFQGAGANQPNTYYYGLSRGMSFKAQPADGVGPYTYSWSNSMGYNIGSNTTKRNIGLYYPTGPSWMVVEITDVGASCTIKDSVYVDYVDYTCNPPGLLWYYQLCNNVSNQSVCVQTYWNMLDSLKTGNYSFGACALPKTNHLTGESVFSMAIYPNPSDGNFTYEITSDNHSNFSTQVMDLNGRVLFSEDFESYSKTTSRELDLSDLESGIYFIRISSDQENRVKRIVIK